ncbi:hypothetical protein DL769_007777 [Monosporascus sp. CRB-8-3]|nr:hypothetical protein DL769_007777 [Monosporascus sp. CRB-8-3]
MASSTAGDALSVGGPNVTSSGSGRGRGDGNTRGRGRGRGRGQGNARGGTSGRLQRGRGRGGSNADPATPLVEQAAAVLPQPADVSPETQLKTAGVQEATTAAAEDDDVEAEVCFICASPVVHQAVTPCNHRTCHICALRMRALYKNKECAHCRTAAPYVVFTDDAAKRYQDYTDADVSSRDENIGIRYANEDIVGDTVLLLRYNCPDNSCDFAGLGWPDLHRHVRSTHHKKMCDLCTRNKKVFTHEHELFTDKELEKHMDRGDDRPGAVDQTGFKGHPKCDFCRQRFYDADKLYEHLRERHERCFLCDRQDPRRPHYYLNYDSLEEHFRKDHYLCPDRECLEKKFVVFGSEVDLKAHQLSEHAGALSKDIRRDARLVNMSEFDFRPSYQQQRRGGAGRGRYRDGEAGGSREGRGRGRDPNAEPLPVSSAQPLRRDELAFQRQMAIHSSQSVSNRTFGGQLTSNTPTVAGPSESSDRRAAGSTTATPAAAAAPPTGEMEGLSLTDPNLSPEDRARLVRHSAVVERASNLLQNDRTKLDAFRSHISSYRQGKVTAAGLVDVFFSLFSETSSTALGTLIREVADLFEEKDKADGLRKAWNDWRAINEDYPTLPGLSGMRGATTASSGWASAAAGSPATNATALSQRHTTRVLKLKNSTQQSQRSSVEQSGTWVPVSSSSGPSRPPPAAALFPALPSSSGSNSRNNNNNSASRPSSTALWGASGGSSSQARPAKSAASREDAFPALPAAPKPTTSILGYGSGHLRRDLGGSRDTGFSWGESSAQAAGAANDDGAAGNNDDGGAGKGKKGNKGRKKVLVQWG